MIASYYDLDMNEIETDGLLTTFINIPSTNFSNNWGGGSDGIPPIYLGSEVEQKNIDVTIEILAYDYLDYPLLRDYLYGIFKFGRPFYIVDNRQPGKRHKVILESDFIPTKHNPTNGTATMPLTTVDIHYAESIKTTADIDKNGLRYGDGWSYGMGLLYDDESHKYTHTGTSFKIYNAGSVPIHPFEQELKITIDDVVGSSEYLQLENTTNGSTFRVIEGVGSNQTIVLDGANITSNGTQYLRKTNKQFIELESGWNEFEITGASSARVSFDHPFYYL